ncbi:MAG: UDP-N-acetylmuramoyl-L-alanine--D-glutamate ligase [Elainellaceae cyanobacterium]
MPHAIVIGLGKSGIAAARLLRHQGWHVTVSDRGDSEGLQRNKQTLEQEGIAVQLGQPLAPDASITRIVVSPGMPWDSPTLVHARALGIEVMGEMELAWQTLQTVPWIAVTGTNGKTTVTALIEAVFAAAGHRAPACGNIGRAACEVALESIKEEESPDWIIAEVSSYQIEASPTLSPEIGLWTTFTPDHLNRHITLDRYYRIKAQLLRRSQQQVFNGDDANLRQCVADWPNAKWTRVNRADDTSNPNHPEPATPTPLATINAGWVQVQGSRILPVDAIPMPGHHNQQNVLIAAAAAHLAGIAPEAIAQGIKTFPGVPHRLEQIVCRHGVTFINDSKATNYDAAEVGLRSVAGPVILIAGGDPKVGEDGPWLAQVQAKAAFVLLIGDAAPAFAERLDQVGYHDHKSVETLDIAVPLAASLAQTHSAKTVLLSPACASFDQYRSFEHRGEHFRQLCQNASQC